MHCWSKNNTTFRNPWGENIDGSPSQLDPTQGTVLNFCYLTQLSSTTRTSTPEDGNGSDFRNIVLVLEQQKQVQQSALYDNWLQAGRLHSDFQQRQIFLFQTYSPSLLSRRFFFFFPLRVNPAVCKFDSLFQSRAYVKYPRVIPLSVAPFWQSAWLGRPMCTTLPYEA